MILDALENIEKYAALHKGFPEAVKFLLRPDLSELGVGTYEIDGKNVYAMVSKEQGRKKEDAQLETHDKYIDIQLVLKGVDTMGWRTKTMCKSFATEYDPEADIQFFVDTPDVWLPVQSGFFTIFFPEDAHLPLVSIGELHKIVVKVAIETE